MFCTGPDWCRFDEQGCLVELGPQPRKHTPVARESYMSRKNWVSPDARQEDKIDGFVFGIRLDCNMKLIIKKLIFWIDFLFRLGSRSKYSTWVVALLCGTMSICCFVRESSRCWSWWGNASVKKKYKQCHLWWRKNMRSATFWFVCFGRGTLTAITASPQPGRSVWCSTQLGKLFA